MKNIAILCDGTWNHPDAPCPTNVVKLAEAVQGLGPAGIVQRLFYDPGIGSSGSSLRRQFDGITGLGISKNIVEAYTFLVENFEPGDRIFLFGFSRGAFTVRSLAGLIRTAGILERNAVARVKDAYELYRSRDPITFPNEVGARLFRRTYALEDITPIHFIGVWDTVGALGNPLYAKLGPRIQFHDTDLSSYVTHAYHAVAINELRSKFAPTLWYQRNPVAAQTLEQRWFVGAHADVGGGRPKSVLSNISLDWMLKKANSAGLSVTSPALDLDPLGPVQQSRKGIYRLFPEVHRDIGLDKVAQETGKPMQSYQQIDESVLVRRMKDPTYRPPNLEAYLRQGTRVSGIGAS